MVILILKRQGVGEPEPVARWDDGEWLNGDQRFTQDPAYREYDEGMMLAEFDGPTFFATTQEAYDGN